MKPPRKAPPKLKPSAFTKQLVPPTYERLIAQLRREHPEYSQAEIEAAVAEVSTKHG